MLIKTKKQETQKNNIVDIGTAVIAEITTAKIPPMIVYLRNFFK